MPERHAVADIVDLPLFLARHARTGLGATPTFLLGLSPTLDGVFDIHDEAGRALVAVLIDACENSADAAGLLLLASRDQAPDEDLLTLLLDAALAEARLGSRNQLEVPLEGVLRFAGGHGTNPASISRACLARSRPMRHASTGHPTK